MSSCESNIQKHNYICGKMILQNYVIVSLCQFATEPKTKQVELDKVQLNENIFNNDALVYSGFSSKKVRLAEKGSDRYIQVEFDGLWSKPKARYVCIEPWCGRADTLGFDGDIDQRVGNVSIGGFESVVKSYSIEFSY